MASLSSHPNVFETCLQLLERRGHRLWLTPAEEDESGFGAFHAERDGVTFTAGNPIELLGLATIYEAVGPGEGRPYWWSANGDAASKAWQRLRDEADAREAARNAELEARRASDPAAWEAEVGRERFEPG